MIFSTLKTIFLKITSTRAAGMYILLFAIAIGGATFVENDFGTSAAQKLIFKSWWFELLLLLFGFTILANMRRYQLVKQKKWASLCFHLSIIVILIGAAITRNIGTEGMMHIREGDISNKYLSAENFIKFQVLKNGKSYSFDEPVLFASLGNNKFENSYQIGNSLIEVKLDKFIPNPKEMAVENANGQPLLKVVIAGAGGREEYYVKQGDKVQINGINFNFSNENLSDAFNVSLQGDSLMFNTNASVSQMVMATQTKSELAAGQSYPLRLRSMYVVNGSQFVIGDYIPKGTVSLESGDVKLKNESAMGLDMDISVNGKSQKAFITGHKGDEGMPKTLDFGELQMAVSYGSKVEELPFSLRCNDFILEKYPGTENPSSYASEVTLVDTRENINRNQRIFMNNILDHDSYRFFQSSFDQDEQGTYLSVNHDRLGSIISYIGYALLTIGLILTFFSKKSRFSVLTKRLSEFQNSATVLFIMFVFIFSNTNKIYAQELIIGAQINSEHAKNFGETLVMQDQNGRVKPMSTYSSEILRKLSRKESLFGQTANQIILSMILDPAQWQSAELIQVPDHAELKKILGTKAKLVGYASFFGKDGNYILEEPVRKAQNMMPKDQGTFEKALIKVDEKVNIVNMIFSGHLFRIFPKIIDSTNTWDSVSEILHEHQGAIANPETKELFMNYLKALTDGVNGGNYTGANDALSKMVSYQRLHGNSIIPSEAKLGAEIWLNKLDVFNRLRSYYGILCLIFLGMFFYITLKAKEKREKWTKYAFYAMALGFIFHTLGLGLRWYISGRAPWSNGYESMIYIGWTTMLGGTLFSRKSLGGLTATATLAATILLVASMSWLDPEITPLVPVLKSYWLTIHVSLEAGSYGFLMLGAVIGMLNLVLMLFLNEKNKANIQRTVKELTIISEITLLGGLTMVSIGTYLGGVWANESWGRYWGWDAKETWALVTILVYAFILHMRFIPKIQGVFAFNFASLFGFGTVIMTYLGVNYYLSGLHSYAAGDPVPMPPQVYYTVIILVVLSIFSFLKYRKV